MSSFNSDAWKNATTDQLPENEPPEPGNYMVTVRDAGAFTSKAGNDIVKAELEILPGNEYAGHRWTVISGFKSEGATGVTKALCSRLGVRIDDVASLGELDTELRGVIGQYYEVAVKQNGEYRNTYVNDRITAAPSSDVPSDTSDFEPPQSSLVPQGAGDNDDEPIPF